ncbi:MAG: hypothetical protein ACI35O_12435 [Bacillaceae bacterium]
MIYHLKYKYFYRNRAGLFFSEDGESGYKKMIIKIQSDNEFEAIKTGYTIILNYKSKHDGDLYMFKNGKELNDNHFLEIVKVEKEVELT